MRRRRYFSKRICVSRSTAPYTPHSDATFARPGILPVELHGWLLDAAKARAVSDYRIDGHITLDETATHIERAEQFLAEVTAALEKAPENDA